MNKSSKYVIQLTISAISINKSQVKNLESYLTKQLTSVFDKLEVDLVQPMVVNETEYPIVNDRLLISSIIDSAVELSEDTMNDLKSEVGNIVSNYLNAKGIIFKISLVTIFKL